MDDTSSLYEFVGIGELAETTTHLLSLTLQQTVVGDSRQSTRLGRVERLVLQQAQSYLRTVREGFVLSVRTAQTSHPSEIRYLLDRVFSDLAQITGDLGLDESGWGIPRSERGSEANASASAAPTQADNQIEQVRHQLLAFGMAVVALGILPRLPSKQITFPHSYSNPPTYSDIPVPHTAGEMLWRIEELEKMIVQMMAGDIQALVQRRYGPLRRTYGFFEASAWLSRKEAERFGIKKQRNTLALF
jgi:hypothetical protein